ncbi:MAG TPA: carboxypeptidase-like regulatory domain-containing protein [Hymenobacter sp.]|jgi:hypothetical protein
MKLTAYPFDETTGELLPVYRDAYLRGDLSVKNTQLVDAYLKSDSTHANQTWQRFHSMQQDGEQVQAVGWMQRQLNLAGTAPLRMRRQVAGLFVLAALAGGAVFAGTGAPTEATLGADAPAAATMRMATVRGKILDENGRPIIGATVFEKGSARGVSTNADGEYALLVPAGQATTLAYGFGGYLDEEVRVSGASRAIDNVTMLPNYEAPAKPARKAKRWFWFN